MQSHVYVNPLTLHSQDLINNSPNCFLYNPYDVSLEKSVMDQLLTPSASSVWYQNENFSMKLSFVMRSVPLIFKGLLWQQMSLT